MVGMSEKEHSADDAAHRVCAREGCENPVSGRKKYCSPKCKQKAQDARHREQRQNTKRANGMAIPWHNRAEEAKRKFLERYRVTGNIRASCLHAGRTRSSYYEWMRCDPTFAKMAGEAYQDHLDTMEDEVCRRAYDGVPKPVVQRGRIAVDESGNPLYLREYSDNLLIRYMEAHHPAYKRRTALEVSGPDGEPIRIEDMTDDDERRLVRETEKFLGFLTHDPEPSECG